MLFPILNLLYFYISTTRNACAQCPIWLFSVVTLRPILQVCWSGIFWMIFKCFQLRHLSLVSLLFFHCTWAVLYTARSSYFKIFSTSFLIIFPYPENAVSICRHVPFSLSGIMMSGLLLGAVLSVFTCWSHNNINSTSWLVSTDFLRPLTKIASATLYSCVFNKHSSS